MNNRKRKATSQLSPYSTADSDPDTIEEKPGEMVVPRKIARVNKGATHFNGEVAKFFKGIDLMKGVVESEKIASLNACFINAVKKIVQVDESKNLKYIFEQYSKFIEEIQKN